MRAPTLIGLLILLGCALGLYQVKYMVRDVKKDVASLSAQLSQEQRQMHVLDAEWAHLIRPDRLEKLTADHLSLVPVSARQMQQDIEVIPVREVAPEGQDAPPAIPVSSPGMAPAPAPVTTLTASPVSYAR